MHIHLLHEISMPETCLFLERVFKPSKETQHDLEVQRVFGTLICKEIIDTYDDINKVGCMIIMCIRILDMPKTNCLPFKGWLCIFHQNKA